jgi:hypothetical protein
MRNGWLITVIRIKTTLAYPYAIFYMGLIT